MRDPTARKSELTYRSVDVTSPMRSATVPGLVHIVVPVLMGARKSAPNTTFDQITVHRINIVEPHGTTRMVLSNNAEFPGAYYMGKEYPRTDRDATGMLFNDEEGARKLYLFRPKVNCIGYLQHVPMRPLTAILAHLLPLRGGQALRLGKLTTATTFLERG